MNNILKNVLYFICFAGIICLSIYTYQVASHFSLPEESNSTIEMENTQIFYYENGKEFLNFKANKINFSEDWKNITAKGNIEGEINVTENQEPAVFNCNEISYNYFQKYISAKDNIKIFLDNNISIDTEECKIDIENNNIIFNKNLNFTSKYGTATASSAIVDMLSKNISLSKTTFKFNLL